jgi:hypothetical protein
MNPRNLSDGQPQTLTAEHHQPTCRAIFFESGGMNSKVTPK